MKKYWIIAGMLTGVLSFSAFPVHALIDSDDLVLGGVTLGESYEEVEAQYGPPTQRKIGGFWYGSIYYGDTVQMTIEPDRDKPDTYYIYGVTSRGNNGLATPKGITVGSTEEEVLEAYGGPDRTFFDHGDGGQNYMYYDNENFKRGAYLLVHMHQGVVASLTIHVNTGE